MRELLVHVVAGLLLVACGGAATSNTVSTSLSPNTLRTTSVTQATPTTFREGTIPAVLAANGRFETLLDVFERDAPGLLGFVSDERFNGTLFAPTDEAFAALSTGTLEELRSQEVGTGRSALFFVLQHHVVAGRWLATQLREREVIGPGATEGAGGHGGLIMIEVDGDDVRVDGALVIEADIEASNGIIHVIDGVMIPEDLDSQAQEP